MINPLNPKSTDPNKIKKCNCEDKHGPKPFNTNTVYKPNSNKSN